MYDMDDTQTAEAEFEISLDTLSGLADFVAYIETQHEDFLRDAATLAGDDSFSITIKTGIAAYAELTRYVIQAEKILDTGNILDTTLVRLIQETYDEFIRVYELLSAHVEAANATPSLSADIEDTAPEEIGVHPTVGIETAVEEQVGEKIEIPTFISEDFFADDEIKQAIYMHYGTLASFEAALWRLVRKIETPQPLDTFLGVRHGSIFKAILKDQRLSDIDFFNQQSGQRIREALTIMEVEDGVVYDYRIYTRWMNEYTELRSFLELDPDMQFADLLGFALLLPHLELQ